MKKITMIGMATLMLGISTINTGCMGSFGLTKAVYGWNDGATGNKFLDNFIFWIFGGIGVYGATIFIDTVVLNLIEFWTGSNPMAMKEGEKETQVVMGKDGNQYQMTATQNRMEIVALGGANKGEVTALVYTPANKTWNKEVNNTLQPIAAMHEDLNKIEVFALDGSSHLVDMNAAYLNSVAN